MMHQTATRQSRIPEQQGIGQTLPPVPVGIDTSNAPPLPPGAMPAGTKLQVGKYTVIIHNFIAEGGFAHVYLARIEGKTGYVVLKRVVVPDQERLKTVEKEIEFMRRLGDHKNIVRYYESRIDILPAGGYEAFILMEYCPGGGVIDLMNRRLQQRLTEPEILKIFSDVTEALAYMHYCNPPVLHRDLKVENILILNQDHYKLCDFGSAALSKGQYVPNTIKDIQRLEDDIQRHTTLQYRAPEMIDVYQKRPVNEKADIWAMGVLLYKLCYYTTPFEEEGQLAILNAKYTIPNLPVFSEGLRRLIMSMLQEDQNRRPNIYQVMKTVCQLRGVECPIRDIYSSDPYVSPIPSSPPTVQTYYENSNLFEKVSANHYQSELPHITPMRRGRPTKSVDSYDPFDPAHVNKTSPSAAQPVSPIASFQNNFDTVNSSQEKQQQQKEEKVEEEKKEEVKINKKVSSSIEARFTALKNASKGKKPLPPPKPAKFRSNPVAVDDFEHKFPSLEELDKQLPAI
ncbi:unnamed protein product [Rhizopus microsporus]